LVREVELEELDLLEMELLEILDLLDREEQLGRMVLEILGRPVLKEILDQLVIWV
jgi:hypothetical protein